MSQPNLTFFCELKPEPLKALFADGSVIENLFSLKARVSLGLMDLGSERANLVRRLNDAGIPVVAWLLLPEEQGYWFNLRNAPQAVARYAEFKSWSERHGLRWAGVGLDIEPDIQEFQHYFSSKLRLLPLMWRRLFNHDQYRQARRSYQGLIERMRGDGFTVYNYELPFIADDLMAGSTLLQRLTGIPALPSTQRVPMVYNSFFRPLGPGLLGSYAAKAPSVAVGVTGGGVQLKGMERFTPLNRQEFFRDLRLARSYTKNIHVFSLEGCVDQGFLRDLIGFDWQRAISKPRVRIGLINWCRGVLRMGLWVTASPVGAVGVVTGAAAIMFAGASRASDTIIRLFQ